MNLIKLNINEILLLDGIEFDHDIEALNNQAMKEKSLEKQLELLNLAAKLIEKFHSYFHFEQSYFHNLLAQFYQGDKRREQLQAALFQDHLNKQAQNLLDGLEDKIKYQRPFPSFSAYLSFALEKPVENAKLKGFWAIKPATAENLEEIITQIRKCHLGYHLESAKLYLNRALVFHKSGQLELSKNDLVKANNLDTDLKTRDYYLQTILQMGTRVGLGLGSNLGDREGYLNQAIDKLKELHVLEDIVCSKIIESKADLKPGSPLAWNLDYLNMAVTGITMLSPQELLKAIKDIEQMLGRSSIETWSPREIDIDILVYGDLKIDQQDLQIPHPRLFERPWALNPLKEIMEF